MSLRDVRQGRSAYTLIETAGTATANGIPISTIKSPGAHVGQHANRGAGVRQAPSLQVALVAFRHAVGSSTAIPAAASKAARHLFTIGQVGGLDGF